MAKTIELSLDRKQLVKCWNGVNMIANQLNQQRISLSSQEETQDIIGFLEDQIGHDLKLLNQISAALNTLEREET